MNACRLTLIVSLFSALVFSGDVSAQPLHYGDFSTALSGWTTLGDVTVENEEAVLGDNGATYSILYQGIPLAAGDYTFEFDFRNRLSGTVPLEPPRHLFRHPLFHE
ncbi:hypothetical protein [Geobacter sp.]|uniref:hypothetical protein n=1 Tax=Geobacter sp. TaxID=46610 RepID=UPI001AD0518B|nr:hypothetical protein [Geobacter sp.]CAG0967923.1 hypothetical protein GEOBC_01105 [Geobacteraceae bacterium]